MASNKKDQGAQVLRIRGDAHAALLRKYAEYYRHQIQNVEGENTPVNRGLVIALDYLLRQDQRWEYNANVQMHVATSIKPRLDRTHMSMIMGTMIDLTSVATADDAARILARMPKTTPAGKHRATARR